MARRWFIMLLGWVLGFTPMVQQAAEPPASLAHPSPAWSESLQRSGYASTPLETPPELCGLLVLVCQFKDQPLRLLVDTGAERTILREEAAQAIGLKPTKTDQQLLGIDGPLPSREGRISAWKIGPLDLPPTVVLIAPLFAGTNAPRLDGILGGDLLAACDAVISFREPRLWLRDPRRSSPSPKPPATPNPSAVAMTVTTPLVFHEHRPFVRAEIQAQTATLLVDTGAYANLLDLRFCQRAQLVPGAMDQVIRAVGGFTAAAKVQVPRLTLGPLDLPGVDFLTLDLAAASDAPPFAGILGIATLRASGAILSYPDRILSLEPSGGVIAAPPLTPPGKKMKDASSACAP